MTLKVKQTPEQIIVFGEIAASLREWCKTNKKTARDINAIVGKPASYSAGFQWLNGKGAPSKYNRVLLSKATGISEAKLMRREYSEDVTIEKPIIQNVVSAFPGKIADVMSFTVNNNGEARIKLDVTLPIDQAMPLFRIILDTGILMESNNGPTSND